MSKTTAGVVPLGAEIELPDPDAVWAQHEPYGPWESPAAIGVDVTLSREDAVIAIDVGARDRVSRVCMRWRRDLAEDLLIVGDAWERTYGGIQWVGYPASRNAQVDEDVAAALRLALDGGIPGGIEPLDWLTTTTPERWGSSEGEIVYHWLESMGANPFEWGENNR